MSETPADSQRIDKWLWHARVTKTRTLAQTLIARNKVRVNRKIVGNASQAVRTGDVVTVSLPGRIRVVNVLGLAERRGSPEDARAICEDCTLR